MQIQLYDTLSRSIRPFNTIKPGIVKFYTCGLTVYSQPQIGNWVAYIYSDVLHRLFLLHDLKVDRVQNITDVGHLVSDDDSGEDKMQKGAKKEGLTAWQVAEKYMSIADHEAYTLLGLLRPTKMIRATDLISQQVEYVKILEKKGFIYTIKDGLYFDTSKLDDYGKLARLDVDGLKAGARVDVGGKKNITDFAVWKFSPIGQRRDMEWESPWGTGFPGWHLECSVIAHEGLGDQIDIHTGGIDHIPVHHTNEIAQTESITNKTFSQFWFHNNHIKINGKKLSKSSGNSYTLQDITNKGFSLEAFKLMVLSSHYRTEGNFSWDILEAAQNRFRDLQAWADLQFQSFTSPELAENYINQLKILTREVSNDLNTPAALALLSQMEKKVEDLGADSNAIKHAALFIDDLLGFSLSKRQNITNEQKALLGRRMEARNAKDWAKSDEIRSELKGQGISVRDAAFGQVWSRSD